MKIFKTNTLLLNELMSCLEKKREVFMRIWCARKMEYGLCFVVGASISALAILIVNIMLLKMSFHFNMVNGFPVMVFPAIMCNVFSLWLLYGMFFGEYNTGGSNEGVTHGK